MENILNFLPDDESWNHSINYQTINDDVLTCVLNCQEAISLGIFNIYPQLGIYISFGF